VEILLSNWIRTDGEQRPVLFVAVAHPKFGWVPVLTFTFAIRGEPHYRPHGDRSARPKFRL
jgi:hypothetical protein